MPLPSNEDRRYTDEEVADILKRALQPVPGSKRLPARRPSEGITLTQLESIASEAGIDPARVRQAALTRGQEPSSGSGSSLLGPGISHVFDRVIEGELPPDRLSDVVASLRRLTRVTGKVTEVGDWLEWTSDATTIHVTVKPESGRTRVQFMGNAGPGLIGTIAPTAVATFFALMLLGNGGMLSVGLGAGIVGGALTFVRGVWEIVGRRAARKYRRLVDRLTAEIEGLTEVQEVSGPDDRASMHVHAVEESDAGGGDAPRDRR